MKQLAVTVPLMLALAACGSSSVASTPPASPSPSAARSVATVSPVASASPSADSSAAPSPTSLPSQGRPVTPSYAVLVDLTTSAQTYILSLVDAKGNVVQQVNDVRQRTPMVTNRGTGIQLPNVSATSDSLYYLDGDSRLMVVKLGGKPAVAGVLDVPSGSAGGFAVSPDNSTIAVTVMDFTTYPVRLTLYTDSVGGGHKRVIFQSTSNYVWPVAWHSGLLVLAHAFGPFEESISPAAPARGNPYSAISYHLVDPTNAVRKVLMGECTVSGPLSPAGSGCIQGDAIDWKGRSSGPWSTTDWGMRSSAAALSPDGQWIAAAIPDNPTMMGIWRRDGTVVNQVPGPGLHEWAGWFDGQTIITGSTDGAWQPEVTNVIAGGSVYVVPARGFFAGLFPTDIV